MYELPLMGHALVAYCWGGKSQNIEGALKTNLKAFFFIQNKVPCFLLSGFVVQCYSHKFELEG